MNHSSLYSWYSSSAADTRRCCDPHILLSYDNTVITNTDSFRYALSQKRPNETMALRVLRKGQKIDITIKLSERPEKIRDSIYYENKKKKIVD